MLFYPGGTFINSDIVGYSFFFNFFSDLGNTISYSGHNNLISSSLFTVTFTIFNLSTLIFLLSSYRIFKETEKNLCNSSVIISMLAAGSLLGVIFSPADIKPEDHIFFAHNGFFWIFISFLIYSRNLFLTPAYSNRYAIPFLLFIGMLLLNALGGILQLDKSSFEGLFFQVTLQKILFYIWCSILVIISIKNLKIYSKMRYSESKSSFSVFLSVDQKTGNK
jgi:hypothetical protein